MAGRWIRLDLSWSESYWLSELPPASRLSWVELLCYVKAFGTQGRVKRMQPKRAGQRWSVPTNYVTKMEEAAVKDGALAIEGSEWVVTNWHSYQEPSTERVRKHRASKGISGNETERNIGERDETKETKGTHTLTLTETLTDTLTDKEHTAVAVRANGGSIAERVGKVVDHAEGQATAATTRADLAFVVFTYWAARTSANPKRTKWDSKRKTRLVARLKENEDDISELLCVVDGALTDDFHKGENDRGRPFLQIQTIFRDREMVEKLATLSPHHGKDTHPFLAAP